jgi:uncharacterized cupredoxin-like copper-binding protein
MHVRTLALGLLFALFLVSVACAPSGEGGRKIDITQQDEGCTPTSIDAQPGEKLQLVVKNDSGKDYEVEGIEGTRLEEIIVPSGRTRSVGYTVPGEEGDYPLKCYVPGGVSTIISVVASGDPVVGSSEETERPGDETEAPMADITVFSILNEFVIGPDVSSVAAGTIEFVAENIGEQVHELAVMKVRDDGSFEVLGEIENLDPGTSGAITLNVESGRYQLACLIVPGQAGSLVDHYQEGMYTDFTVE